MDGGSGASSVARFLPRILMAWAVWVALAIPTPVSAQFDSDSRFVGVHLGLAGVGSVASVGANGEIALDDRFGIGAWVDTWRFGQAFGFPSRVFEWQVRYVALAATGAYHFPVESNPKVDPFAGVAVGYYVVSASTSAITGEIFAGDVSRMFIGGFAGVRYAFKPDVHGVAHIGVGSSYITIGVDFGL